MLYYIFFIRENTIIDNFWKQYYRFTGKFKKISNLAEWLQWIEPIIILTLIKLLQRINEQNRIIYVKAAYMKINGMILKADKDAECFIKS